MTSYNTGNPIGSKDPRDLYDNAENLDEAVNTRTAESWDDRFGVARKTWWGMEQDFQQFLINSGYETIGDYGPGLEITALNQTFRHDGEWYRAGAGLTLPYTTTGVWGDEKDSFVLIGGREVVPAGSGVAMFATEGYMEQYMPITSPLFLTTAGRSAAGDGRASIFTRNGTDSGDIVITLEDGVTKVGYDLTDASLSYIADQNLSYAEKEKAKDNLGYYGDSIVILATGQSNIQANPAYNWTPPDNLFLWNGFTTTGTAFTPMPSTVMRVSCSFAAEIAKNNPTKKVYVVNIGRGSMPISRWMVGATNPDMYAECKNNIEAALSVLGRTSIDHFFWWQGESDHMNGNLNYYADFRTVWQRFMTESWFPRETPMVIMSVSNLYVMDPPMRAFNNTLRRIAGAESEFRTFVDLSQLSASYWESSGAPNLHMTGRGYRVAGKIAYAAVFEGKGPDLDRNRWQIVSKTEDEVKVNDTTTENDDELYVYLTAGTWNLRAKIIIGMSATPGGIKYNLTASTSGRVLARVILSKPGSEDEITVLSGTFPSGSFSSAGFTILSVEISCNVTSPGLFRFRWAQNTESEGATTVYAGSFIEYVQASGI